MFAALTCGAGARALAKAQAADLQPMDSYYGVYMNGIKVGWMRTRIEVGARVTLSTQLQAQVGGMGTVAKIDLEERRDYDAKSGRLLSLLFQQSAATGAVRVEGEANDAGKLRLRVQAGSQVTGQQVDIVEDLDDAVAAQQLARRAKVGDKLTTEHFDASLQRTVTIDYEVKAVESFLFGGVQTKGIKLQTAYRDLGISETSWLDAAGKVLETRVGQFFVARLEAPDVAQKLDYQQDLLVSAVVKAPRRLPKSAELRRLSVTFSGFASELPPASPRQEVRRAGDLVTLELSRDPEPGEIPLPLKTSAADAAFLEATPFVQSDAAKIVHAARQAIDGAKDVFTATSRLSSFVYEHVRDEYVPAYSNALEALETARGDCTEHSILFVALARALGIPARVVVGIAYWPPGDGFGWHAWAEVKAGATWYAVDPTWNQPIADATHIKLAEGGPAEQARIVMLLGQLRVVDLKS